MGLPLVKLTDEELRDLAGTQSFERGRRYALQGRVAIDSCTDAVIRGTVAGTEDYDVRLSLQGDELEWNCSCPAAEDGSFCKHLVALVLAAHGAIDATELASDTGDQRGAELQDFLRAQSVDRLVGLLLDFAESDPSIEKRLRLLQSQSNPKALRKALSAILRARSLLDWRASNEFARSLDPVIDVLAAAASLDPIQGIDLYEYALTRLLKIYEQSDDSGGSIADRVRELVTGYKHALEQGPADGDERGRRMLKLERLDQWRFFDLASFWPLLGEAGQRAYAASVEIDFAALPPPAQVASRGQRWIDEFPVVDRMERLAVLRGDIDLRIRIIARDLTSGHAYERIVEICREAGRRREAMQWAERGYKHHPTWRGMRALLAEEYQQAGLDEEALALLWEDFRHEKEAASWHRLKTAAGDQWPTYRARALDHVQSAERQAPDGRRDMSTRVALLLADGDAQAACTLAEAHVVGLGVLERLARAVSSTHPALAASFLKRVVEATLPKLDARHYGDAVAQIREILALNPGEDAGAWLTDLKVRYRARRKLIALLDEPTSSSPNGRRDGLSAR